MTATASMDAGTSGFAQPDRADIIATMIRPLHESDHTVGDDGTVSLRNLKPGARVHVVVVESSEDHLEWGTGSIPESRIYQPSKPRLPWGAMKGTITRYDRPFDPACDPDEWEANR